MNKSEHLASLLKSVKQASAAENYEELCILFDEIEQIEGFDAQWFVDQFGPSAIFSSAFVTFALSQYLFLIHPFVQTRNESIQQASAESTEVTVGASTEERPDLNATRQIETIETAQLSNADNPEGLEQTVKTVTEYTPQSQTDSKSGETEASPNLLQHTGFSLGLLGFMAVSLYLPQLLKLKVAGIEMEKGSVDQIQTSRNFGIKR